jgi:hypothetical protein
VKRNESLKVLVPMEVEVAFDSEVKADLFMNAGGTIVGPEGTETIVSVHEAIAAGYSFVWKTKDEVTMSKNGKVLPVEVHNGTPVLPNDMCLKLIEKIEMMKRVNLRPVKIEAQEDEFELQSVWPQLSKVLKWLIVNKVDKAVEVLKVVACRRNDEMDLEKERINNPIEELGLIVVTIKKTMEVKAEKTKIRKIKKDEKRYGLLDSGGHQQCPRSEEKGKSERTSTNRSRNSVRL